MSVLPSRQTNPHIGTYLAIYTSALAALVLLLVILEQLGTSDARLRNLMILVPIGLYVIIGVASRAATAEEFFVADRAVSAFFTGFASAVTMLGGVGFVAIAGTIFLVGVDGMAIAVAMMLGILVMAVLLAPYIRKFGAYTVADYLGRRFESRAVRVVAGLVFLLAAMLILVAEFKIGIFLAATILDRPVEVIMPIAGLAVFVTVAFGGSKSLTWSNCAQGVALLFGLVTPLVILSVMLTNLPFAHLTYGGLLETVTRREAALGLVAGHAGGFGISLPGPGLESFARPFLGAFASLTPAGYLMLVSSVMAGVAVLPGVLVRVSQTPSVFEARRAMGWTVVMVGFVLASLPAYAVFTRYLVLGELTGSGLHGASDWFARLQAIGLAGQVPDAGPLDVASMRFARDGTLIILPMVAGLPSAIVYLAMSGILAAAFAGASARVLAAANIVTEDLIYGLSREVREGAGRITVARLLAAVVAGTGAYMALQVRADPLRLLFYALAIAGSATFGVLVMSIWWKRINQAGALAGIVGGGLFAGGGIFLAEQGDMASIFGFDPLLAGAIGVPLSILFAVIASLGGARPGRGARNFVADLRIPGGETIRDRERRIALGRSPRRKT